MSNGFQERIASIKNKLLSLSEAEDRYAYIIELGRSAAPFPNQWKTKENIVPGCQSILYLHTETKNGNLFFGAHSEALISAGLAELLIAVYNDTSPRDLLLNPPTFLQEIGLLASLSPSRSNGLASIYKRMKHEAMQLVLTQSGQTTL